MAYTNTIARVKGGMPLDVWGDVSETYDGAGRGWIEVEISSIRWANTGKPVSKNFENSLTESDFESIREALIEAE